MPFLIIHDFWKGFVRNHEASSFPPSPLSFCTSVCQPDLSSLVFLLEQYPWGISSHLQSCSQHIPGVGNSGFLLRSCRKKKKKNWNTYGQRISTYCISPYPLKNCHWTLIFPFGLISKFSFRGECIYTLWMSDLLILIIHKCVFKKCVIVEVA